MGICCTKHSSMVQPLVSSEYLPSTEEVRSDSRQSQRSVKTAWTISGHHVDDRYQDVENFGLCEVSIDDVTGQPVIVISRCRFPSRKAFNEKNILGYLKYILDKYVESDYAVLYCHYNVMDDNRPSFSWFKEAYAELDRKYKKNLKCFYIVHPTSTIRILMNLFKPIISVKFGRKLRYVNFLHEIGSEVSWQKLPISSDVLQHDRDLVEKHDPNTSYSHLENNGVSAQPNPTQQFGVSLETLREQAPDRIIPRVMQETIQYLSECGLLAEGLFRKSPSAIVLKKVESLYNQDENVIFDDPHLAASTLKSFLRKLPEPVLTFSFYQYAIDMIELDSEEYISNLRRHLHELPRTNFIVIKYLMKFLCSVVDNSEVNKMTVSNLAVVFGPSISWPADEVASPLTTIHCINNLVASLLNNYDLLFEDADTTITTVAAAPTK